jgi:hypothetical protein
MSDSNYQNQLNEWMSDWKKKFEEMQEQLSSGKVDAVEMFEKQKEQMRSALHTLKLNVDKVTDAGEEQMKNMKTRIEELQLQLSLGKAEGYDLFREQKKKIEEAVEEMNRAGKAIYHQGFEQGMEVFEHNSKAFKTGLEIVQLQYALAKMDLKDDAVRLRGELNEKMKEMQDIYGQGQKMLAEQMKEWNQLWQDGYNKMKTWSEGWQVR